MINTSLYRSGCCCGAAVRGSGAQAQQTRQAEDRQTQALFCARPPTEPSRVQVQQVVPLVGGPTAVSRVEAELWREANAEGGGGGFLGTRVTTDDGEVVYADRMKLMAWCA